MKSILRIATTTAVLLAISAFDLGSVASAAAGPVDCKICGPTIEIEGHVFSQTGCDDDTNPFCMNCHTFNACHTSPLGQAGSCLDWHWQCYRGIDALAPLEEMIDSESLEGASVLAASFPETIAIDEAGFVLVLNCDGAVVRAVKMEPDPEPGIRTFVS